MATITSAQSGNFNAGSTWVGGAVPADNDTFIINYGHVVTVNDDRRTATGYGTSADNYVRGKLHITGTGKIRFNGITWVDNSGSYWVHFTEGQNSAGFFRMDPGAKVEIRGTNSEQHSIRIQNHGYVTFEVEGTNPNPQTTIIENANLGDSRLTFLSTSQFAVGDWINVYKRERPGKNWLHNKSDESFWIHDVDYVDDYVYVRHFVSPTAVIQSVSGANVVVDNAAVFRAGYKVIFGTGANRNILTISSINYSTNTLTMSANVTGAVTGLNIYCTGCERGHPSGDDVLRVAATQTADANSGSNSIVVNNVNGFSVGDLIMIPNNNPPDTGTWDYVMDYTIKNINPATKTITFEEGYTNSTQSTLPFNSKAGNLIVNLTRDTQITAPEGTAYGADQRSFIYALYGGNYPYHRRIRMLNAFINLGTNTASTDYGTMGMRYGFSYDLASYGAYTSTVDGCVFTPVQRDYTYTIMLWERHQMNDRHNVFYNYNGLGARRNGNNSGWFANIACRTSNRGFSFDGGYEPVGQISYNYIIRCWYGWEFSQWCDITLVNHNYALFVDALFYGAYHTAGTQFDRMYSNYFRRWPHWTRASLVYFTNSYFGNDWDATSPTGTGLYTSGVDQADEGYNQLNRLSGAYGSLTVSLCHNFEYNKSAANNRQAFRQWDVAEQAWRVRPDVNDSGFKGFTNLLFVPAGTTVTIRASIKLGSAANTSYPYIYIRSHFDGFYPGYCFTIDNTQLTSFSDPRFSPAIGCVDTSERFTVAAASDYESKSKTVGPFGFDLMLLVGVAANNNGGAGNSGVGWWEKDLEINYDIPDYNTESINIVHQLTTKRSITMPGTIVKTNKLRLGG